MLLPSARLMVRVAATSVPFCFLLLSHSCSGLVLQSGQRIAPRRSNQNQRLDHYDDDSSNNNNNHRHQTLTDDVYAATAAATTTTTGISSAGGSRNHHHHRRRRSLLELQEVEQWATERGVAEHHLRSLYRVVLSVMMNTGTRSVPTVSAAAATTSPTSYREDSAAAADDDLHLRAHLLRNDFPSRHVDDLLSKFRLRTCRVVEIRPSASGGRKLVLEFPPSSGGAGTNTKKILVETVLIRHTTQPKQAQQQNYGAGGCSSRKNKSSASSRQQRYTVCVSSQVGCARACSFCATGTLGLQENLSAGEILEQVWMAQHVLAAAADGDDNDAPSLVRNVVFMGQGEPLDNYGAVHEALRGLTHQCLFGFKAKHVTVSTVGASPTHIRMLAEDAPQISLAVSLHGATQELRQTLMPATRKARLHELEAALDYHANVTGLGVMVEYLLIDGVNDSDEAAEALVRFCFVRKQTPYVNLIPYNPTIAGVEFGYSTPTDDAVHRFHNRLMSAGIRSHVRWSSAAGRDTDGACGQLALSILSSNEQPAQ
jgi:adenine C2-methylase RlmN of 23S rRNA A2503 and tRNA A37